MTQTSCELKMQLEQKLSVVAKILDVLSFVLNLHTAFGLKLMSSIMLPATLLNGECKIHHDALHSLDIGHRTVA